MKQRTIKYSIDEATGRIGFIVEQDAGSSESVTDILEFIGVLDHLKQIQLDKLKLKGRKVFDG